MDANAPSRPPQMQASKTYATPEDYAAANPLGGPAVIFEAIAARIRAGEDFYAVLDDCGFMVKPDKRSVDGRQLSALALEKFKAYFRKNYPGPDTIIHNPDWHAPKIFNAVLSALERAAKENQ